MAVFYPKRHALYEGVSWEQPSRLERILRYVDGEGVEGGERAEKAVDRVHGKEYRERIKAWSEAGALVRADLNFQPSTYTAALDSVESAIRAAEEGGFALARPPGHHAWRRAEGFCYFNNVVAAVEEVYGDKRAAVLDIDAHYGNGTHELWKEREDRFYASLHADVKRHYPGYRVEGGKAFLLDVDPKEVDDDAFLSLVGELVDAVREFQPDVVAVSAGFDTFVKDPVLGFAVERAETYEEVGRMLRGTATFSVLEGGYSREIGLLVGHFLRGLGYRVKYEEIWEESAKVVGSFEREKGREYFLTPMGDVFEVEKRVRKVGSFPAREGKRYEIVKDKVVERSTVKLPWELFWEWKRTGVLADAYRKGLHVEVEEEEVGSLKELEGATILSVEEKGGEIVVRTSKGTLVLKESGVGEGLYRMVWHRGGF